MTLTHRLSRVPLLLAIAVLLIVVIYPLIWLFLSSLKTDTEFTLRPLYALPQGLDWQNYVDALTTGNLGTYFLNSVLTVFPSLFMILLLSVCAGFGLQVMIWRGRNLVLLVFLAGIMVPLQMVLLPLFTIYFHVNLIDTRWSLIVTYTGFGLPLSVFLMAGFFKSLSREMIEAATMDGAGIYQIFFRIAVPLAANGLATIGLVQFFFLWNDLLFSLTFITSDSMRTIQTGLYAFTGQYGADLLGADLRGGVSCGVSYPHALSRAQSACNEGTGGGLAQRLKAMTCTTARSSTPEPPYPVAPAD